MVAELCRVPEALLALCGHVDGGHEGYQADGGADIRGRALAADVLLAGLKGEHVAGAPLGIDGLADDATG